MTPLTAPPREPRTAVMLNATVAIAGRASATRHRVLNLSETGLCVAAAGAMARGDLVTVSLGALERAAGQVMWIRGGVAGIAFRQPICVSDAYRRAPALSDPKRPSRAGWLAALHHPAAR